jgi:hypothetical protein
MGGSSWCRHTWESTRTEHMQTGKQRATIHTHTYIHTLIHADLHEEGLELEPVCGDGDLLAHEVAPVAGHGLLLLLQQPLVPEHLVDAVVKDHAVVSTPRGPDVRGLCWVALSEGDTPPQGMHAYD